MIKNSLLISPATTIRCIFAIISLFNRSLYLITIDVAYTVKIKWVGYKFNYAEGAG